MTRTQECKRKSVQISISGKGYLFSTHVRPLTLVNLLEEEKKTDLALYGYSETVMTVLIKCLNRKGAVLSRHLQIYGNRRNPRLNSENLYINSGRAEE